MTDPEIRRRPGGRSARVRRAVLDATLDILGEKGVDGVSVAEVAARSGVHETSVYRRWGTREKLVVDALLSFSDEELPIPDTGSLRGDLSAFAGELLEYLSSPLGKALLHALASAGDDPAAGEARSRFWQTRRDLAGVMVERAMARGEVPGTVDVDTVLEMLIAPLHFRVLLTHQPLEKGLPERLADLVVAGVGATAGGPPRAGG